MTWSELETGAPELARDGWERFERTHVAMLGTLRADGSPRISPVEPFILGGELVFGVMPSPKWQDLHRDPRAVLHSSVSDIEGSQGEFKVHGRVEPADDPEIVDAPGTWWAGRPRDRFEVFAVRIDEAVLVTWSTGHGRMTTSRWTPERGAHQRERTYP